MLLLKQDTIKKEQMDENVTKLDANNSKKYKVEAIWYNAIYVEESESSQLPGFYYLVA